METKLENNLLQKILEMKSNLFVIKQSEEKENANISVFRRLIAESMNEEKGQNLVENPDKLKEEKLIELTKLFENMYEIDPNLGLILQTEGRAGQSVLLPGSNWNKQQLTSGDELQEMYDNNKQQSFFTELQNSYLSTGEVNIREKGYDPVYSNEKTYEKRIKAMQMAEIFYNKITFIDYNNGMKWLQLNEGNKSSIIKLVSEIDNRLLSDNLNYEMSYDAFKDTITINLSDYNDRKKLNFNKNIITIDLVMEKINFQEPNIDDNDQIVGYYKNIDSKDLDSDKIKELREICNLTKPEVLQRK